MRYKVIFWMFSLLSFIIWSGDTGRESIQAAGKATTLLAMPANSSVQHSSNKPETCMALTENCKDLTQYFLMSDGLLERSTLLTGSDRGTAASLLVVEKWESSPIEDHYTYDDVLKCLNSNKVYNTKLKGDYSNTLLSADAMKAGIK